MDELKLISKYEKICEIKISVEKRKAENMSYW